MSITAIIAEYNPFHNGHCYHIRQSKRSLGPTYTIAVLSGSFVQRAEPAVLSKRARTEQALRCGVDAVIAAIVCLRLHDQIFVKRHERSFLPCCSYYIFYSNSIPPTCANVNTLL